MGRESLLVGPFLFVLSACLGTGEESSTKKPDLEAIALSAAAATISEGDFARKLGVLTHDSMEGRFTPSAGLDKAATWVAAEFDRLGLAPSTDSAGFLQTYSLAPFGVSGNDKGTPSTAVNVVAVLPGIDPTLRREYVIVSAHIDHLGIGQAVQGDSIYNGADDNGSGTVAVLELAEAFASNGLTPRRSVVFLLVSGEERGLWGSEYFADNMPFSPKSVVANLNIDMIGRNWTDTIVAIGMDASDLGLTLTDISEAHPELGITVVPDPWPESRYYFRSDHYNFARKGIPILFFFNGVHPDYHRPSDEAQFINVEKASRIARLIFYLTYEVANRDRRPEWKTRSRRRIVDGLDGRR